MLYQIFGFARDMNSSAFRDGDWFAKFLDSGEQALVTLMLFNDVKTRAGPTYICEDGLTHMIKWYCIPMLI